MKIFLVGGAIRDRLLSFPYHERDWLVVGATQQEMLDLGYIQVGKDFPVFLHPATKEEYALARTERKSGSGYTGFTFDTSDKVTIEEDLIRRDLTINAIAESATGEIIDPYGGAGDIQNKILRHISPAFAEDPVRILRTARFAARYTHLGFSIAGETYDLMRVMVATGEVDHLVSERVWKELSRALEEKTPSQCIITLRECGALQKIIPELDALFGIPQRKEHHPEVDTGIHALLSLEKAVEYGGGLEARFATLMHDLGKGTTPVDMLPKHIGHEERGIPLINTLCDRLSVPNNCKDLALLVAQYHTHCHRALELKPQTIQKLLESLDAIRKPERFKQFLLACQADSQGRTGFEQRPYPQRNFLHKAFKATQTVQAKNLIEQGFKGKELGDEIRKQKLNAIKAFKQLYAEQNS